MNVWIIYRDNGKDGYDLIRLFSRFKLAEKYFDSLDAYEKVLHHIDEDWVEFDEES